MNRKYHISLNQLIKHLTTIKSYYSIKADIVISGIKYDSREIIPGDIFVAIKGEFHNGHDFIETAVKNGAVAILGDRKIERLSVPYIQVSNTRKALAELSAAFYDFPASNLFVIGVTGTDGKTTTVNLIYQILKSANLKAGMISTVNAILEYEIIDTGFHVTTPESPLIQKLLAKMVEKGITHVVLEATSHGLQQHRITGCEINVGVITNITHEHLDYHGDYQNYLNAKASLLTRIAFTKPKVFSETRIAIINQDDSSFKPLHDLLEKAEYKNIEVVSYSQNQKSDIRARKIKLTQGGISFDIDYDDSQINVTSPLIGQYNVSNILAAFAAIYYGLNIPVGKIINGIENLRSVPGRMEKIELGQDFTAIVDFAHTPNALKMALVTARNITKGRVITIFGCAGLRDRQKRRIMPEISVKMADISIYTAEDPRTESLEAILSEMAKAATTKGYQKGRDFFIIPDRGEAVIQATKLAENGDVVIACGKGHEQSMCFGNHEYAWDDRIAMKAALAKLLGIDGPEMPYLPTQKK